MVKCPFCQFDNEEGALFCDQCKSDLGVLETEPSFPPIPIAEISSQSIEDPIPVDDASPLAEPASPVPMDFPIRLAPAPVIADIPVATAVKPGPPIPIARVVEAHLEEVPHATPIPSNDIEPAPTQPVALKGTTTISSLDTYRGLSTTAPTSSNVEPDPPHARDTDVLPTGGKPRLLVLRGQKVNVEYPLYEGGNFIGRADERPVDIDLEDQEPPDRVWSSRQHALIHLENGNLVIEDQKQWET